MVDIFNWRKAHPGRPRRSLLYWGHYVAHDNNRDAMGVTLKLTAERAEHVSSTGRRRCCTTCTSRSPYLYDNTVGDGPYNAWLDPLLTNEWQMVGWNNVQEMTRLGMPGVYAHGDVGHLVAGLSHVHGGDAQRHQPPVRDVRQRRQRRDAWSGRSRPDETSNDLVPAEPAAAARDVVAAQQQQLRADRAARLAQLLREQPPAVPRRTSARRASARS